jgi:hypothetical protein
MQEDPIESVYSFVERTYMQMQAGEILTRCMEEGSSAPVQQTVENLVLGGPHGLNELREFLTETERRKMQVRDDLNQLLKNLEGSLKSFGVSLKKETNIEASIGLRNVDLFSFSRGPVIHDHETQQACEQILKDYQDLHESLNSQFLLLQEIKSYLQDWIWGLVVQEFHRRVWPQDSHIESFRQ